jgi:hypothetical protein
MLWCVQMGGSLYSAGGSLAISDCTFQDSQAVSTTCICFTLSIHVYLYVFSWDRPIEVRDTIHQEALCFLVYLWKQVLTLLSLALYRVGDCGLCRVSSGGELLHAFYYDSHANHTDTHVYIHIYIDIFVCMYIYIYVTSYCLVSLCVCSLVVRCMPRPRLVWVSAWQHSRSATHRYATE